MGGFKGPGAAAGHYGVVQALIPNQVLYVLYSTVAYCTGAMRHGSSYVLYLWFGLLPRWGEAASVAGRLVYSRL
jgi:hypothetical protein